MARNEFRESPAEFPKPPNSSREARNSLRLLPFRLAPASNTPSPSRPGWRPPLFRPHRSPRPLSRFRAADGSLWGDSDREGMQATADDRRCSGGGGDRLDPPMQGGRVATGIAGGAGIFEAPGELTPPLEGAGHAVEDRDRRRRGQGAVAAGAAARVPGLPGEAGAGGRQGLDLQADTERLARPAAGMAEG